MNEDTLSSVAATAPTSAPRREVVGLFAARKDFEAAVAALKEAGFERADLSVLSSHESIDAAEDAEETDEPWKDALTALVGELKYEGPLVASGAILLAGGPTAAAIAAVIAATTAGVAAFQVLEEVTDKPQTEDFARSLKAGSVILWVTAAARDREETAAAILSDHGGSNVHVIKTGGNKS